MNKFTKDNAIDEKIIKFLNNRVQSGTSDSINSPDLRQVALSIKDIAKLQLLGMSISSRMERILEEVKNHSISDEEIKIMMIEISALFNERDRIREKILKDNNLSLEMFEDGKNPEELKKKSESDSNNGGCVVFIIIIIWLILIVFF